MKERFFGIFNRNKTKTEIDTTKNLISESVVSSTSNCKAISTTDQSIKIPKIKITKIGGGGRFDMQMTQVATSAFNSQCTQTSDFKSDLKKTVEEKLDGNIKEVEKGVSIGILNKTEVENITRNTTNIKNSFNATSFSDCLTEQITKQSIEGSEIEIGEISGADVIIDLKQQIASTLVNTCIQNNKQLSEEITELDTTLTNAIDKSKEGLDIAGMFKDLMGALKSPLVIMAILGGFIFIILAAVFLPRFLSKKSNGSQYANYGNSPAASSSRPESFTSYVTNPWNYRSPLTSTTNMPGIVDIPSLL